MAQARRDSVATTESIKPRSNDQNQSQMRFKRGKTEGQIPWNSFPKCRVGQTSAMKENSPHHNGATNFREAPLSCEELKPATQNRMLQESVACLRHGLLRRPGGAECKSLLNWSCTGRLESLRKLVGKLGREKQLKACYEADGRPWVCIEQVCVECEVIAQSLREAKARNRSMLPKNWLGVSPWRSDGLCWPAVQL